MEREQPGVAEETRGPCQPGVGAERRQLLQRTRLDHAVGARPRCEADLNGGHAAPPARRSPRLPGRKSAEESRPEPRRECRPRAAHRSARVRPQAPPAAPPGYLRAAAGLSPPAPP